MTRSEYRRFQEWAPQEPRMTKCKECGVKLRNNALICHDCYPASHNGEPAPESIFGKRENSFFENP
jgi:ribosomal protein L32